MTPRPCTLRGARTWLAGLTMAGLVAAGAPVLATPAAGPRETWQPGPSLLAPAVSRPASAAVRGAALSGVLGSRDGLLDRLDERPTTLWTWPLRGTPKIVRPYDPPARDWLPGHRGIDLQGVVGEDVLAVDAGVVSHSGTIAGVPTVSITHASGIRSTYQPVEGAPPVGTRVGRGQVIGSLGFGGHCSGCLHLGAKRGRKIYLDPTPLLLGVELTLLPLG